MKCGIFLKRGKFVFQKNSAHFYKIVCPSSKITIMQTRRPKPNSKKRRRLRGDTRNPEAHVFESESDLGDLFDDLPGLHDDSNFVMEASLEEVISTASLTALSTSLFY